MLTGAKGKRGVYLFFGILYGLSTASFLTFNVLLIMDVSRLKVQNAEGTVGALFTFILLCAYLRSLVQLQRIVGQTGAVIERRIQLLNVLLFFGLFANQIYFLCSTPDDQL